MISIRWEEERSESQRMFVFGRMNKIEKVMIFRRTFLGKSVSY